MYGLLVSHADTDIMTHPKCYPAQFPWAEAVDALDQNDPTSFTYFQQLVDALVPFLVMPPAEIQDAPCHPPVLADSLIDCKQYPTEH